MKKMTKAMLMTALIIGAVQWGGTAVYAGETLQEFTLDPMIVTASRMEKMLVTGVLEWIVTEDARKQLRVK